MTNNNRERVIKLEKGQTLYVVCPPYQPFKVFYHPERRDLVIDDRIEPQDVPAIEENAPAIPITATEVIQRGHNHEPPVNFTREPERRPSIGEPGAIVDAEYDFEPGKPAHIGPREDVNVAIEQGLLKPVFPDRFNKPTSEAHVDAVTETLGAAVELYRHEKEVRGATIVKYTPDKPESSESHDQVKPAPLPTPDTDRPVQANTDSQADGKKPSIDDMRTYDDLFGNPLNSDIPFFNEPA